MQPVLFNLGPIQIYSYGFMLALASLVSVYLSASSAAKEGLDPGAVWDLGFWILLCGIIGARIAYIILNLSYFISSPKEIFMLNHGGLAWYGGLVFGSLGGFTYLKIKKFSILKYIDLMAPYVALGQAIGRIGCFLNGCCYGKACIAFGIYSPVHEDILIPTQLISSFLLVLIFLVLRFYQSKKPKIGNVFFVYLALYSIKRFLVQFLRDDDPVIFLGLTGFQIASLILFFVALVLLIKNNSQKQECKNSSSK